MRIIAVVQEQPQHDQHPGNLHTARPSALLKTLCAQDSYIWRYGILSAPTHLREDERTVAPRFQAPQQQRQLLLRGGARGGAASCLTVMPNPVRDEVSAVASVVHAAGTHALRAVRLDPLHRGATHGSWRVFDNDYREPQGNSQISPFLSCAHAVPPYLQLAAVVLDQPLVGEEQLLPDVGQAQGSTPLRPLRQGHGGAPRACAHLQYTSIRTPES